MERCTAKLNEMRILRSIVFSVSVCTVCSNTELLWN